MKRDVDDLDRRTVLEAVGGVVSAGMLGLAGCSSSGTEGSGSGNTVTVGQKGNLTFEPEELTVTTGTEVTWDWDSDRHNIVVESQPKGANWEGTEGGENDLYDRGHEYKFAFETPGTYEYYCAPHRSAGMVGTVVVEDD